MARVLVLSFEDEVSEFSLSRVDRGKLYGTKKRVVTDEDGQPCASAFLSSDGSTLVPAGGYTMAYLDSAGSVISRNDLVTVDAYGDVLDKLPSTLNVEHELYGPVDPARVLDHVTTSVYRLDDDKIGEALAARLDAGDIFEAEFRYTASTATNALFIVRNDQGTFGLVSRPLDLTFVQPDAPPELNEDEDDEESDFDDDLDFTF